MKIKIGILCFCLLLVGSLGFLFLHAQNDTEPMLAPLNPAFLKVIEAKQAETFYQDPKLGYIPGPTVYTLTIQVNTGGTTNPVPGTHTYLPGTDVQIQAIPDPYCALTGWSGDASGKAYTVIIKMDRDKSVTANFKLVSPPSNLTAVRLTNRSVTRTEYIVDLSWDANTANAGLNIVIYCVYQKTGDTWVKLAELPVNERTYRIRKAPKAAQTYGVTLVNEGGVESARTTTAPSSPSAPSAPTGVTATPGNGQVTISWNAVTGATSYNIYWSTTSGVTAANGTKISGAANPYTHTNRTNGTPYYYKVTAVGAGGESPLSSEVSATPMILGVLEGATNYIGSYPGVADVVFVDSDNTTKTVTAYPGQVQVFFSPSTTQSYAQSVIQSKGGTLLSSIPRLGYYLAQVSVGAERTFITAVRADANVKRATPNIPMAIELDGVVINEDYLTNRIPIPLNVHGPVAIDDGTHGLEVVAAAQANGGTITDIVNVNKSLDGMTSGDKLMVAVAAIAQGNDIFNPGATTFINFSQGWGYKDDAQSGDTNGNGKLGDWSNWENLSPSLKQIATDNRMSSMAVTLDALAALPSNLLDNTFLTLAAGNNKMPLDSIMNTLRADPVRDTILGTHIAIVTSPLQIYNQANQAAAGDPSVVVMLNSQAAYGTSFAAPAANAAVQHLTAQDILDMQTWTGASFAQITKAADIAKAANATHSVIPDEVEAIANLIVEATGNDSVNAYLVTSIAFTSIGSVTSAVISPAAAGVTVAYTVSGTDGYYDSGRIQTNSSGQASFAIPPGWTGVVDTISVVAVLSGRIARTTYTWQMNSAAGKRRVLTRQRVP